MTSHGGLAAFRSRWTFVSVATLAFWLAVQSIKPFIALHLVDLGASEVEVGLAVAAHPLLSLVLAIPAGRFIDERGLRRYMLVSLCLTAAAGIAYSLTGTVLQVAVIQLLAGMAELGAWIGIQALITRSGEHAFRQKHLTLFSIAWGVGIAFGPTLGAWVFDSLGFGPLGLVYAALAVVAAATVSVAPYQDRRTESGPEPGSARPAGMFSAVRDISRRPAILAVLAASFVALWANSLRTSFYPLFLEDNGLSVRTIGLLMSLAGIATLLGRLPMVWLMRRFGSSRVLVGGTAVAVMSLSVTPLLVASPLLLAIGSASFGLGFGLNTPLTVDLMAEHSDDDRRGLAMGMRVASNRSAQVLQPLAFGAVAGIVGMALSFAVSGGVMAIGTVLTARWLRPSSSSGHGVTIADGKGSG